ncbi:hypothetical protein ACFL0W_05110 [Nanoarchaeota archaeon]
MIKTTNKVLKNKLLKNKKGFMEEMIYSLGKILFLIIVFFSILLLVSQFTASDINTSKQEAFFFMEAIVFSPNGLAYHDPVTFRTYPGIVSLENFDSEKLSKGFHFVNNDFIAAKLQLFTTIDEKQEQLAEVIYNEERFEKRWKDIAKIGLPGPGGIDSYLFERYVLIQTPEGPINGKIIAHVLKAR